MPLPAYCGCCFELPGEGLRGLSQLSGGGGVGVLFAASEVSYPPPSQAVNLSSHFPQDTLKSSLLSQKGSSSICPQRLQLSSFLRKCSNRAQRHTSPRAAPTPPSMRPQPFAESWKCLATLSLKSRCFPNSLHPHFRSIQQILGLAFVLLAPCLRTLYMAIWTPGPLLCMK